MTNALDRYFELLGAEGETEHVLGRSGELFAPGAEVSYGGELAVGEQITPFHRRVLSRRKRASFTHSTTAGADGVLTAEWRESGVDLLGDEYRASGTATARVDSAGRISRISVSFDSHSNWEWHILRRHSEAWTESDPLRRSAKIKDVYTEDFTFAAGDVIQGHEAFNEWSGKAQEFQPVVLGEIGEVVRAREYVMYEWHMVTTTGDEASGWEVQRVDGNDKIDQIVMFTKMGSVISPAN